MELKYVWKSRWSSAKFLYIATHYWGISILTIYTALSFNTSNPLICPHYVYTEIPLAVIMILLVEVILIARLYAVYDRRRAILVVTSILAVGTTISTMTMCLIDISKSCHSIRPVLIVSTFSRVILLPQMVCEGCLCALMVIRVYYVYKLSGAGQLLRLLIRDSVIYFFGVFATLLVNAIIWNSVGATLGDFALGWLIAVPCVLGSRLLLNIRRWAVYEKTLFSQIPTTLRFRTASAESDVWHILDHEDITIGTDVTDETEDEG